MVEQIYIDEVNGNDTSGTGSSQNPYKTLHHFMVNIAARSGSSYQILLGKGEYAFSETTFRYFQSSQITIIGQGVKTSLVQSTGINSNGSGVGYNTTTIEFCRLIYKTTIEGPTVNCNCFRWNWIMRNVAFVNIPDDRNGTFPQLGFFIPNGCKLEFYNCIKHKSTIGFLRTTNGTIKVYDSAGPFKSGYATVDANWNASGNLIKELSFSDNFEVISGEHIGLYNGKYAWSENKALIFHDGVYKKWNPGEVSVAYANAVPIMTSNTAPSGKVTTSSIYDTNYDGWKVFNRNESDGWATLYGANAYQWIQYEFPVRNVVSSYSLLPFSNSSLNLNQMPNTWRFEGSNDGSNWDVLDSQSGVTWTARNYKTFTVCKNNFHNFYRLFIISNNGHTNIAIAEIKIETKEISKCSLWESVFDIHQLVEKGMENLTPLLNQISKEFDPIPMIKKSR
ncbi:discoidin domain-containing protein [Lysinibacillus sp. FSL R7-0073]|uniref:discoidin domain-containing protein n=1 Tax=Lysinibacillus TaxID=400634 RepID=UPI002E1A0790|nr:discoidin domain-containing protein [Lysinibacillus fusiformis]